ncbi:hypothetical protein TRVL_01828 [Trypanosoma vivax]|nr:hypothetical protein TRVL_01828 [Trypanosoma vivax]
MLPVSSNAASQAKAAANAQRPAPPKSAVLLSPSAFPHSNCRLQIYCTPLCPVSCMKTPHSYPWPRLRHHMLHSSIRVCLVLASLLNRSSKAAMARIKNTHIFLHSAPSCPFKRLPA